MKKVFTSTVLALALFGFAAPTHAQSANYYIRQQQANDPGYNGWNSGSSYDDYNSYDSYNYSRSNGYSNSYNSDYSYNYDYDYQYSYQNNQNSYRNNQSSSQYRYCQDGTRVRMNQSCPTRTNTHYSNSNQSYYHSTHQPVQTQRSSSSRGRSIINYFFQFFN
jgi:hypothetical protein